MAQLLIKFNVIVLQTYKWILFIITQKMTSQSDSNSRVVFQSQTHLLYQLIKMPTDWLQRVYGRLKEEYQMY